MNPELKKSLCAFVDILGFKSQIKKAYDDGTQVDLLNKIAVALENSTNFIRETAKETDVFFVKFFTDNIVIGFEVLNDRLRPLQLLHHCQVLAHIQFALAQHGFFVRGGIALGTLAYNDQLVFGDALLKAHHLEADEALSPRIILHEQLKRIALDRIVAAKEPEKNWWRTVLNIDSDGFAFVDYLGGTFGGLKAPALQTHREKVEAHLRSEKTEPRVRAKYFWVANYHNSVCGRIGSDDLKIDDSLLLPQQIKP